jgi:cytochrome d ubiquinol oxidase subunit II
MTALTILFTVATAFLILYPDVIVSSIDPAYNLTIYNASSTPYTLKVMTIIALIFVPIVLIYQGWSFWVFRERITEESVLEY